jgi:hypothetical protein
VGRDPDGEAHRREEFEAAARRSLEARFRYAFIRTYKPVLEDARYRSFDSTADYRRWCQESLPGWLGHGRVGVPPGRGDPGRARAPRRPPPLHRQVGRHPLRLPAHHPGRRPVRREGRRQRAGPGGALRELGFAPTDPQAGDIERGKEFVPLENGPFDLHLAFAPDGIERFADAWARRVDVEGFPVCHIDDIIASKEAAGRVRDRESLPRLRSFRDYRRARHPERPGPGRPS